MPDREKVIKGLKHIQGLTTLQCLTFPRERIEFHELIADALALLKEQEAVDPVNVRWVMGINGGNCPKCMNWVQRTYNYCPFCGQAVKWK